MSDKHTDAQDGAPYDVVFKAIAAGTTVAGGNVSISVSQFYSALICSGYRISATEGQAQTSAAVLTQAQQSDARYRQGYGDGWNEGRAAQLADSTAPGKAEFNAGFADVIAQNEAIASANMAAPTAQQSLTGGAVPEWKLARIQRMIAQYGSLSHTHWPLAPMTQLAEIMAAVKEIAAAPLPQVQSEAMDVNVLEYAALVCEGLEGDMFDQYKGRGKYEPFNPHRGDTYMNGQSDGAGQCAAAIRKCKADQQPVTPSGALADNDGGVKS